MRVCLCVCVVDRIFCAFSSSFSNVHFELDCCQLLPQCYCCQLNKTKKFYKLKKFIGWGNRPVDLIIVSFFWRGGNINDRIEIGIGFGR